MMDIFHGANTVQGIGGAEMPALERSGLRNPWQVAWRAKRDTFDFGGARVLETDMNSGHEATILTSLPQPK
jgi:hypothetical protein